MESFNLTIPAEVKLELLVGKKLVQSSVLEN
jgi:hypothetical protein